MTNGKLPQWLAVHCNQCTFLFGGICVCSLQEVKATALAKFGPLSNLGEAYTGLRVPGLPTVALVPGYESTLSSMTMSGFVLFHSHCIFLQIDAFFKSFGFSAGCWQKEEDNACESHALKVLCQF